MARLTRKSSGPLRSTGAQLRAAGRAFTKILGAELIVHINDSAEYEAPDPEDTIKVVDAAVINEFGGLSVDKKVIPERSAFRDTREAHAAKWEKGAVGVCKDILFMPERDPVARIKAIGQGVVADLKNTIEEFSSPPNAAWTVEVKGFDDPLVFTGKLQESLETKFEAGDVDFTTLAEFQSIADAIDRIVAAWG